LVSGSCKTAWKKMIEDFNYQFWNDREKEYCSVVLQNEIANCCQEVCG
jgi:hypothetical protein